MLQDFKVDVCLVIDWNRMPVLSVMEEKAGELSKVVNRKPMLPLIVIR